MRKLIRKGVLILIMIDLAFSGIAQQDPCPGAGKMGVRIVNKAYFRYFSLLLQDTCNPYNRFDNDFFHYEGNSSFNNGGYCPAVQIDSILLIRIEKWCKDSLRSSVDQKLNDPIDPNGRKQRVFYYAVNKYRYIRLYMGYRDNKDNLCILVQYVTKKQIDKNPLYRSCFNMIALGRNYKNDPLRYLKLMINKKGEIVIL